MTEQVENNEKLEAEEEVIERTVDELEAAS